MIYRQVPVHLSFVALLFSAAFLAAEAPCAERDDRRDLTKLVAQVDPAVVTITLDDQSLGAGFVIDPQGLIITNYHVIEGAKSAKVVFADKTSFTVEGFLALAPGKDLALLEIRPGGKKLPALRVADNPPEKGERVFAFGAPMGLSGSVSDGIVAALRSGEDVRQTLRGLSSKRDIYRETLGYDLDAHWVQTTAPISPGNSGGPLVNDRGEVVGLNTWCNALGQNLNFAISAAHVKQLLASAKKTAQPLSQLPPPRKGRESQRKGDAQKTLAVWRQLNELKSKLNKSTAASEKKLEQVPQLDPRNPNKGLNLRLKKLSSIYIEMSRAYRDCAAEVKNLGQEGIDSELLALTLAEGDLAQRTSDAYQQIATALTTQSDFDSLEATYRVKVLKRSATDLRTSSDVIRLRLSQRYAQSFPTLATIEKEMAAGQAAVPSRPGGNNPVKTGATQAAPQSGTKPPSQAVLRAWTDRTGTYQIQAKLLGIENGVVKLEKSDGTTIDVSIEKLSEADQRFIGTQR